MEARERIRSQLDELFVGAPQNRAAWELQEELLANSMEKYQDLLSTGMDEESAMNSVLAGIGNVDELIAALPGDYVEEQMYHDEMRSRSAMTTAIAVGLYIAAGVVFFLGMFLASFLWEPAMFIGLILAGLICIIPTCMLVYNAKRYPSYKKKEETVVEEFKEWSNDSKKAKSLRAAVSSLLWTVVTLVYLAVSFLTFQWHITWIIFLIGACLEAAINLAFRLGEMK